MSDGAVDTTKDRWEVPVGWAWSTMGDVAEVIGGGTPSTTDDKNFGGEIPWITPADLSGYRSKTIGRGQRNLTQAGLDGSGAKLMPAGTVLFSSRAPIGYVAIASNPVTTNQGFKSFVLRKWLSPDYVYYYLQRAKDLAVARASGTTFLEISGAKARTIPIPVAPRPEQDRIVAELEKQLTRLDAGVAALKRVQAQLKRYRASVLKAACEGRLVPTEAELARREKRDYEPADKLLERILKERRARWEADQLAKMKAAGKTPKDDKWKAKYSPPASAAEGLPGLPEGWCWASLDELSTRITDGVHKKPSYVESGVPFVTVRNLTAGSEIDFENLNFISEADHAEYTKRTKPELDDLLISKDGTLGVVRRIRTLRPFSIFVSVALLKPVSRQLSPYLEYALRAPQVQRQMVPKGTGLVHLHLEDLREDCVPLPPLTEQARLVSELEDRLSVVEAQEHVVATAIARAASLRRAVLQRAFEGQLVPQNSSDEPASKLLQRIRPTASSEPAPEQRRSKRPTKAPARKASV